jgi:hypothetical protein
MNQNVKAKSTVLEEYVDRYRKSKLTGVREDFIDKPQEKIIIIDLH